MGNFLPNCGIRRVAEKLPEGVLDERDIALHHTLFPYTFRFQDLATKEKLLEKALSEKVRFPIKLPKPYTSTVLKYCPLSYRALWRGLLACYPSNSICDDMHKTQVQAENEG